jgi:hypothetical protein
VNTPFISELTRSKIFVEMRLQELLAHQAPLQLWMQPEAQTTNVQVVSVTIKVE